MTQHHSFNLCSPIPCRGILVATFVWGLCTIGSVPLMAEETIEPSNETSFSRLAEAKVAEAVNLTDEQRGQVATLITARAEALAKAAPADRPQVIAQSEKDLSAILNDEQRVLFVRETAEPRLHFNFRFQRWTDVLEWFAKQADLSLVLDAPPPGTFNYSDSKSYTVVEALDLLNGVLSTKGYTLIRRGRMLLVVDVQDGIPEGLIPRIPLEEITKRGKFELVSVVFPLGDLDGAAVKTEITPLLGPYGKSALLPQSKQLLVTDTAGIMRAVSAVISSMPKPASATAPVPLYGVYPLKGVDPKIAEDVLTKMFPGAKIAADIKAEQINAYAVPAEQVAIKGVIEQMQAQNPPEKKPLLEVYPIRDQQDATQLVANLTLVAPLGRITFDPRERQIVAFASPLDQANIKSAIEKLAVTGSGDKSRQLDVYRLSKADPVTTLTLLQGLLPQTKLSLDPQTRRLVAIATPDDHKAIKAILDQLQSVEPGPDTQTLKIYPLDHPLPPTSLAVLTTLAPKAQIVPNVEAKQLQVLASPADHVLIKTNLEELLKEVPAQEKRQVVVYHVTPTQRTKFQTLLPSLTTDFPDIRMVVEGEPNELTIWAKPSQHELLKTVIETLVTDGNEQGKQQLTSHPLRSADPTTALTVLKGLVPNAKISLDSVNRNLVAIASPEDHALIKANIEKLQPGDLGPDAPVLRFYPLEQPLPPSTLAAFTRLVPKATVTLDADGKWLQVVATATDHALVKSNLEELTKGLPLVEKRKLVVYHVTPIQRTKFQTLLPSLTVDFPEIRLVAEGEPNELTIWAKPSQHELLKTVIETLVTDGNEEGKRQLVSHPLRSADPTTALTVLKGLVPNAKISLDSLNRNLVAIASPEDHALIKTNIEKLQPGDLGPDAPVLRFYPLEQPLPPSALAAFTRLVPKATVTLDTDGKWLQVVATALDHTLVKNNLEELTKGLPLVEKRKLLVYPVTPAQRTRFQSVLPSLMADLPEIRVVTDGTLNELAIWAKPSQHTVLKSVLDELKTEAPANEKNQLVSYPLKFADPTTASTVLQTLFPGAKINVDTTTNRLLIWARPADHIAVKQAVDELDGDKASERQDKVMVYPIPEIDPDTAVAMLMSILPKIRVMKDVKARTVVAWGKKADHEIIAKTLAAMRASTEGDQKPHLKIYPAGKINAANMIEVLRITFPSAKLAVDTRTGGLAALGTAAEQAEIQSAINQMVSQAIGETGRFVTYRLFKTERETAMSVLTQAVPEARVTTGKDPTQLLAWARPADHTIIERIIDELESESAPNKGFELKVYTVKSAGASNITTVLGRAVPKAMVNPSADPNRLVIWALPSDHLLISQIIKQFDTEHTSDFKIEFYDIQKLDSEASLRLAQAILQKHGPGSTAALIQGTNQLYVEARPEQQEMIREALMGLRATPETEFEAFQLDTVDATAADALIRRMFSNTKTIPPLVEADSNSQKLYVRGTKEQITRVRTLLGKMGETGIGATGGSNTSRRVRVIPFTGDAGTALEEIQRIWPRLRPNELRVVPAAGLKSILTSPTQNDLPLNESKPGTPAPSSKPNPPVPDDKPDNDRDGAMLDDAPDQGHGLPGNRRRTGRPEKTTAKTMATPVAHKKTVALAEAADPIVDPVANPTAERDENTPPPIIVLPKDGNITIFSEDTEALDQLDKLLRGMARPTEVAGRGFGVYALKNSGAASVAETIQKSLRIQSTTGGTSRNSGPTVVADDRLNAIVVHANRTDRMAIEKLIEALDSAEIPDSSNRPRRVAIKHGYALQIEPVLRLVYKAQLTTGGGRKELPIPPGLAPEVAATLQQMNAMNTGPLLTLSVDETSNSIVIMAPNSLAEQVTKLIEELDQAALNENAQAMNLIPTERMSSVRAQKILNLLLDKTKRTKRP